jgi:hypothetical protein
MVVSFQEDKSNVILTRLTGGEVPIAIHGETLACKKFNSNLVSNNGIITVVLQVQRCS